MKKLLFAVSALAALSLLAPSTGFAQIHDYDNQVGLFLSADGTGGTNSNDIGTPVFVYLVLLRPVDDLNGGAPYGDINAFECTLTFTGGALFKLGDALPPTGINVGDNTDIGQGFLEYIVGIGTSVPVTLGSVTLITFQFMATTPAETIIALTPTSRPGIPGEMAFQSVSGQLRIMYDAGGEADAPVFSFNGVDGGVVAVEDASFGSVKSLYR